MKKLLLVLTVLSLLSPLFSEASGGINIPQLNADLMSLDGYLNNIESSSQEQKALLSQQKKKIDEQQKSLENLQSSMTEISSQLATLDSRCKKSESKLSFWRKFTIAAVSIDIVSAGVIYGLIKFR